MFTNKLKMDSVAEQVAKILESDPPFDADPPKNIPKEHGGISRARHLAKSAIPKDTKKEEVTKAEVKKIADKEAHKEVKGHEKKMHHVEHYLFKDVLLDSLNVSLEEQLTEVLSKDAGAADWIHDFVHSDNPKFKGMSKKKRIQMALGAYYKKQRNEEYELDEKIDPTEKTVDMLRGRVKLPKHVAYDNEHNSAKVELKAEAKRPESDTVPFVTDEGTHITKIKERAKSALHRVREMLGKAPGN